MHAETGGDNARNVSGGENDRKHTAGKQVLRRLVQHFAIVRFLSQFLFFKPPPPVGAGGGYIYVFGSSVRAAVRASVRDSRGSFMFLRYLQYLLTDFCQTFVTGASWDTDDLLGQKVKVQGHTIATEAHSTRRYRRVQLFPVFSALTLLVG